MTGREIMSTAREAAAERSMDKKLMRFILLIGVFVSVPLAINAHHGTGISYNLTLQPVTAKGRVTEFKWANPHGRTSGL